MALLLRAFATQGWGPESGCSAPCKSQAWLHVPGTPVLSWAGTVGSWELTGQPALSENVEFQVQWETLCKTITQRVGSSPGPLYVQACTPHIHVHTHKYGRGKHMNHHRTCSWIIINYCLREGSGTHLPLPPIQDLVLKVLQDRDLEVMLGILISWRCLLYR